MSRGVLYTVWGDNEELLERSIASHGLPYHVKRLPSHSTLLTKAGMFDWSPFDTTLFLDVDTVVLGDLAFGFQKAEQFGLACCICECPYAKRFPSLKEHGDLVEYNTGVLFFTKKAHPVFRAWSLLSVTLDSSLPFMRGDELVTMPLNDQASFALAVQHTGFNPFVLPLNWNLRVRWQHTCFGEVKIWHDHSPVPADLIEWNKKQEVIQFTRLLP
jgi:hypothetical protein